MKKQIAVSAAILFATGAISVHAADSKECKIHLEDIFDCVKENCIYEKTEKLWDILESLGITIPDFNIPDFILPDFKPEDKPEEDLPETDKPDSEAPDTDVPETEGPESDLPESDTPVIPEEKPEDTPGTDNSPDNNGNISANAYVNEVLKLVNEYRASNGLSPVSLDNAISSAADIRAKEIVRSFSHTRPDGRSCFTVLSENGISYNGAGENIAYGQDTPKEVMTAWMNSQGHRANILNSSFTKLGVGIYSSGGTVYWVQLFTY